MDLGVRDAGRIYESGYIKRKKRYLIDVQFATDKKLEITQDRQTLQNSDENNIFSIGSYVWLFLQDFLQHRFLVETLC